MHSKTLFALDLGTTKFCLAALLWQGDKHSLEVIDIPADGMHRGMVADVSRAERCLGELIDKAEKRLNNLGYFKKVRITNEPGSSPDRVVINVDVEDQPTGSFGISGGYSTVEGFIASMP